ncbi:MAG: glycogen/starch synthase, partial [Clostridia bacterium]|nr:glycogen/starch synthase [Clostridia bacterium]
DMKTVYTIHNLQYQGVFPIKAVQDTLGLGDDLFTSDKLECYGCANYMKAGLVYADELTTVSPSYSDEIQTAFYGERLDGLLRARKEQLSGILNGIDMVDYDPEHDPMIYANYGAFSLGGKETCKAELQKELGLTVDPEAPVVGIISRLSNQKGLDLIECVIRELMDTGIQLVVLGMGEAKYTNLFSWAESEYPGRLAARFAMNHQLAHRIYAGADMFLMPSQFEPCGLSQLIALRYGTVPIVRETGGLRDTVLSYNKFTDEGNGFSFFNYNAHDMLHTVRRAVHYYKNNREVWYKLIVRGMLGDYSWTVSAKKYLDLYEKLVKPATDFSLAEEVKAEEVPFEAPAAEEAPEAPVVEEVKAEEAPAAEEVKAEEAPAAPAAEEVKAEEPKKAPAKKAAAKKPAAKKPAAKKAPAKKAEAAEAPAEEAKAEEAPVKKAPAKKSPAKKTTKKAEAPAEEAKPEEVKAEEAPAKPKRAPRKKKEIPAELRLSIRAPARGLRAGLFLIISQGDMYEDYSAYPQIRLCACALVGVDGALCSLLPHSRKPGQRGLPHRYARHNADDLCLLSRSAGVFKS